MKDLVQNLCNEIASMPTPVDYKLLKEKLSLPSLTTATPPPELLPIVNKLLALTQLVEAHLQSSLQFVDLDNINQGISSLTKKKEDEEKERAIINHTLVKQVQELDALYQEIILKVSKIAIPYENLPDVDAQSEIITNTRTGILDKLRKFNTPQAKLTARQIELEIEKNNKELNILGFYLPDNDAQDRFDNLLAHIKKTISELSILKDSFNTLAEALRISMPEHEVQKKITDLEKYAVEVDKEQLTISGNSLTEEERNQLTIEMNQFDKKSLVQKYTDKIDGTISYINPGSWLNYFTNAEYHNEQKKYERYADFLHQLIKKEQLVKEHARYQQQITQLRYIETFSNSTKPDDLLSKINKLFQENRTLILPPSLWCVPDYYLALQDALNNLEYNITRHSQALNKLSDLNLLEESLIKLMNEYNLIKDEYVSKPTLEELETKVLARNKKHKIRDRLTSELELCDLFIKKYDDYNSLKKEEMILKQSISDLCTELHVKTTYLGQHSQAQLVTLMATQQASIAAHIAALPKQASLDPSAPSLPTRKNRDSPSIAAACLSQAVTVTPQTPAPRQISQEAAIVSSASESQVLMRTEADSILQSPIILPSLVNNDVEHPLAETTSGGYTYASTTPAEEVCTANTPVDRILGWHDKINALLVDYPKDIQNWYKEVFESLAVQHIPNNASPWRQAHVVKDILFEFQGLKVSNTIRAYMRLCPKPNTDISRLLQLKPDLSIPDAEDNNPAFLNEYPEQLRPLIDQYHHLKKTHFEEAELLQQAIYSFALAKTYIDSATPNLFSNKHFPAISKDPRYEPLKRHRGILQAWELLEDMIRWAYGKIVGQAEHEYTNRPCFFNTKTGYLFDSIEQMIQLDLAKNS